ncbi:MAG: hypothetical protein RIT24_2636, partial [Planctomycetota bacterium]
MRRLIVALCAALLAGCASSPQEVRQPPQRPNIVL